MERPAERRSHGARSGAHDSRNLVVRTVSEKSEHDDRLVALIKLEKGLINGRPIEDVVFRR